MSGGKVCPISGHEMRPVFREVLLGKHEVTYYYCDESGILQTEKPYWLDEAYEEAIAAADWGLVRRNISNSIRLNAVLSRLFNGRGQFLDVAGGYGVLARLMRDMGVECYTTDKYCKNLFAREFEPCAAFKADALFAFEVLEHIEDPYEFINGLFDKYGCKTLICSTLVYGRAIPGRNWWYYSFESGQHITFYQARTLSLLADKLGCRHYMIGRDLHIMTDRRLRRLDRFVLANEYLFKMSCLYGLWKRRKHNGIWDDLLFVK